MKINIKKFFYTANYLLITSLYIISAFEINEGTLPFYYLKYISWMLIALYSMSALLKRDLRIDKKLVNAVILFQSVHFIIFLNQQYKSFESLFSISVIIILFFTLLPNYNKMNNLVYKMVVFSFFANVLVALFLGMEDIGFQIDRLKNGLRPRLQFLFNHPNYLAQLCYVILITILILLILCKVKYKKVYFFVFVVTLTILILTGSRTAMFLVFLFIGSFYFLEYIGKLSNRYILILLLLTFSFCFIILFVIGINEIFDVVSMKIRLNNWISIIGSMSDKNALLYGIGYFRTTEIDPALIVFYNIPNNIDNSYVLMIMQSGIIGLIANLVLILYMYSRSKLIINKRTRNLYNALFLSFLAYGFTENHLFTIGHVFTVQVWFLLGRLLNEGKNIVEGKPNEYSNNS